MEARPYKVIFDTDPGVDDAMALYFALAHPDIEVIGITTTFGNVAVEQAASNALYLTRIAGVTIPVTQGIAAPLLFPFLRSAWNHRPVNLDWKIITSLLDRIHPHSIE